MADRAYVVDTAQDIEVLSNIVARVGKDNGRVEHVIWRSDKQDFVIIYVFGAADAHRP